MLIQKTKLNDVFTEWFQMQEEFTTPYIPARPKQMSSKVLFVGKKT